ncbi:MAG: aspartyl-tRNA(Asn)/glutamyl-tRNA(Gln) amidotransferase subunit, partial [Actinomycetota bacterium]|nr:aspartyl-tRNA(Asn)/glutamyl-tRNA(Gln) amidotransferase subunit [Actinomycetota bacterium]
MAELHQRDAWELADAIRTGELEAAEVLDTHLERVERFNEELNAFCYLDVDAARRRADEIDAEVRAGRDPGRFAGVPMGVKELAAVEGWPDTHASKLYEHDRAPRDGTEVARLRSEGAVLVGLTTAPEFGSTNWTRTLLHGVTRNPWQPELTPGGSSGGSAAAVSAGMMPICTGGDGGGSIRIPSSYCGLFGFKVTFGRVGDEGPFDDSLTAVPGPMARSVRDAARYIDVIAGPTVIDPTSLPAPATPFEDALLSGAAVERLRGKRAAWSSTLGHAVCDPEVEKLAHEAALALCDDAGVTLVDIDVRLPNAGRAWGILSSLSMAVNHLDAARGRWEDVTPVPRAGLEMIDRITSADVL